MRLSHLFPNIFFPIVEIVIYTLSLLLNLAWMKEIVRNLYIVWDHINTACVVSHQKKNQKKTRSSITVKYYCYYCQPPQYNNFLLTLTLYDGVDYFMHVVHLLFADLPSVCVRTGGVKSETLSPSYYLYWLRITSYFVI